MLSLSSFNTALRCRDMAWTRADKASLLHGLSDCLSPAPFLELPPKLSRDIEVPGLIRSKGC